MIWCGFFISPYLEIYNGNVTDSTSLSSMESLNKFLVSSQNNKICYKTKLLECRKKKILLMFFWVCTVFCVLCTYFPDAASKQNQKTNINITMTVNRRCYHSFANKIMKISLQIEVDLSVAVTLRAPCSCSLSFSTICCAITVHVHKYHTAKETSTQTSKYDMVCIYMEQSHFLRTLFQPLKE